MRVLHVTPSYAPAYAYGGPVQSLEGLVAALAPLGIEQRIVTTDADGPRVLNVPRTWTQHQGIPVIYLRRWRAPDVTPAVLPFAYESCQWADVVHVTGIFCVPSILGLWAARSARKPTVLSVRGALQPVAMETRRERKQAWLQAFEHTYRGVAIFHATAAHEESAIQATFGADRRIAVIPNGTQVLSDDEIHRLRSQNPCEPLLVGMLGRLHPIKAVDRVLESVAILHQRGVPARLEFAGPIQDATYADELTRVANRLGLANHFAMVGPRFGPEQLRFFARCAVMVVASHSENFSNVVVEALNVETPVIASRGTPWAELDDERCGAWVENRPELLADAMGRFLAVREERERAGAAGRALVQRKYTWPSVARRMAETYDALIRRRAGNGL